VRNYGRLPFFFESILPKLNYSHMTVYVLIEDSKTLFLRSSKRTHNIVRSGLNDEDKLLFYDNCQKLYSFLIKNLRYSDIRRYEEKVLSQS